MRLHTAEQAARYAPWWGGPTWDRIFRDRVAEHPNRTAIVDPPNRDTLMDGAPKRLTWAELDAYVDALAAVLLDRGVVRDTVVGVQLPNSVELAAAYLAITRLGAIATPFPVQYREFELEELARLADVRVFVTATRAGSWPAAEAIVGLPLSGLRAVLAFGDDVPEGVTALDVACATASTRLLDRYPNGLDTDSGDCVTICWTSGTEAVPKGVPRCPDDWAPMALGSIDAAELTDRDVLLNPFPMVNMAGIAGMFLPWLMTGAVLVQHHPFDPGVFLGQLVAEQVTYTVVPPALLTTMLRRDDLPIGALASLRVVGSGSAPLTEEMTAGWAERFGIEVINYFGSNEGASLAADPGTVPDHRDRAHYFPRFGSPGHTWSNRASHGMRSRLVDLATELEITEVGVPGELRLKGPGVFSGYVTRDPQARMAAFDEDGWFRTGDMFAYAADASGDPCWLRYVDRAKDIVVRGGMNISAAEVEGHLVAHPAIAEAAIVALPDAVLGERACAVVVVAPGERTPTLAELTAFLRGRHIAVYKLPERLEAVEALPRNPVGKVRKAQLRARFAESAAGPASAPAGSAAGPGASTVPAVEDRPEGGDS
ncbi:class I adenylate-forming enzyme family protein [Embleya sp. NPDC050493]|uniref:class I adenylate-forming enzyme family protein n=1 Tax=Embleya sp. NPDC050493 TaxID=3363989 RepID=UPI0037920360